MDERIYCIWLQHALGVGSTVSERMIECDMTAKQVYDDPSRLFDIVKPEQRKRLQDRRLDAAQKEWDTLSAMGAFVLTPDDEIFRALFTGMYAPPIVVYGKGGCFDPSDAPTVSIVGTRRCDDIGVKVTRRLAAGLAAGGAVIVSGGAEGVDANALEAALLEGGRCISFQACGLDVDYPHATTKLRERLIQHGGMLLSEFPLGAPPLRHHFRIRNRLIAAVSRGTLVTQAPRKSGALITASWAREQGRDVFAVPGSVGTACCEGSNELLKDGAQPVTNAADILMTYIDRYPLVIRIDEAVAAEERAARMRYDELPVKPEKEPLLMRVAVPSEPTTVSYVPCPDTASPDTKRLYASLAQTPQTAAELSAACQLPMATVLSTLTLMELKGLVTCAAGQRYALCTT